MDLFLFSWEAVFEASCNYVNSKRKFIERNSLKSKINYYKLLNFVKSEEKHGDSFGPVTKANFSLS